MDELARPLEARLAREVLASAVGEELFIACLCVDLLAFMVCMHGDTRRLDPEQSRDQPGVDDAIASGLVGRA